MTSRFEEEIGLIKKAVVDFWEGHRSNLAIVSDPFYGESELMDRVEGMAGMEGRGSTLAQYSRVSRPWRRLQEGL